VNQRSHVTENIYIFLRCGGRQPAGFTSSGTRGPAPGTQRGPQPSHAAGQLRPCRV